MLLHVDGCGQGGLCFAVPMARDGLMGDTYLTLDSSEQLERGAGRQDGFIAFRLRSDYCGRFVTSQSHAKTMLRAGGERY